MKPNLPHAVPLLVAVVSLVGCTTLNGVTQPKIGGQIALGDSEANKESSPHPGSSGIALRTLGVVTASVSEVTVQLESVIKSSGDLFPVNNVLAPWPSTLPLAASDIMYLTHVASGSAYGNGYIASNDNYYDSVSSASATFVSYKLPSYSYESFIPVLNGVNASTYSIDANRRWKAEWPTSTASGSNIVTAAGNLRGNRSLMAGSTYYLTPIISGWGEPQNQGTMSIKVTVTDQDGRAVEHLGLGNFEVDGYNLLREQSYGNQSYGFSELGGGSYIIYKWVAKSPGKAATASAFVQVVNSPVEAKQTFYKAKAAHSNR